MKKGYSPPKYYSDVELKPFCHNCHERLTIGMVEQVIIGSGRGKCNALIDTGTTRSCISEAYFKTLPQQNLKGLQ